MKLLPKILFVFFLSFSAVFVYAEEITNFASVYEISQDGTVLVTEKITYDFGDENRHGIFRTLETTHPQPSLTWYKKRSIAIDVVRVQVDGETASFTVVKEDDEIEIRIGDPAVTLTGDHIYTLVYVLRGALSYGAAGAEFYYDVTGTQWQVPVSKVRATVVDASGLLLGTLSECYVGTQGATARCEQKDVLSNQVLFGTQDLLPHEGLTIAQSLKPESVALLVHEEFSINWFFYVLGTVWLFGLSIWAYHFRTLYKSDKPVIAQYEPYGQILPMYTGVLFDGRLDPQDITAGIVYLAEQGYIRIKKTEEKVLWIFNTTDYELILLRNDTEGLAPMLQQILALLFTDLGSDIASFLRSPATAKSPSLKETIAQSQKLIVGQSVRIGTLSKKRNASSQIIKNIQKSVADDLEKDGFIFADLFHSHLNPKQTGLTIFAVIGLLIVSLLFKSMFFGAVICISFGLIVLVHYSRRTTKGYEALNHLKGFKLFLSVTEKDRYTFFNAPEKSPELFMKYLPYAIAFKVEDEWSKVFEGITMPNPDWYEGGATHAFSASALASDIGAFSSSFTASSGVSGSSGGGSSGGGGGGGGGGSW